MKRFFSFCRPFCPSLRPFFHSWEVPHLPTQPWFPATPGAVLTCIHRFPRFGDRACVHACDLEIGENYCFSILQLIEGQKHDLVLLAIDDLAKLGRPDIIMQQKQCRRCCLRCHCLRFGRLRGRGLAQQSRRRRRRCSRVVVVSVVVVRLSIVFVALVTMVFRLWSLLKSSHSKNLLIW